MSAICYFCLIQRILCDCDSLTRKQTGMLLYLALPNFERDFHIYELYFNPYDYILQYK